MESRVELFAQIRRDARVEGLSIRELARRHGVGRPTVRQALDHAEPSPRKPRVRTAPRLDAFKPAIDAMLEQDLDAPKKQRHTARRIFARLADEHHATDLSYSTVRNYVRARRPEIDAASGRLLEVFVPQEHARGAEAEVDFGEVWVILAGVKTKCYMFTFRLSHSFSGWTKTFTDLRLCAAIVVRLTCNGTIIETGTGSYRLAHTRRQIRGEAFSWEG